MKQKLHNCPHCLQVMDMAMAPFRCEAIAQVCPREEDAVYGNFFGLETPPMLGRIIYPEKGKWSSLLKGKDHIKCSHCATLSHKQICMHCHGALPEDFALAQHLPLVIVAPKHEVAQQYLEALRKQLERMSAHDIGATLHPLSTPASFLLDFDVVSKSAKGRGKKVINSFFLLEGHDIHTTRGHDILKKAKGIFFIFSGEVLFNDLPDLKVYSLFQDYITLLEEQYAQGIRAPLAITFTQLEKWVGLLPKASIFFQSPNHVGAYDQRDGRFVSQELSASLGARYGANFLRLFQEKISSFRFFATSLQATPQNVLRDYCRVEVPYLWLLYLAKVIGAK